jgi:hypothetical protein
MREGTTSRVTAADRSYAEFYDFYSVSPEYFGYTLGTIIQITWLRTIRILVRNDFGCRKKITWSNVACCPGNYPAVGHKFESGNSQHEGLPTVRMKDSVLP